MIVRTNNDVDAIHGVQRRARCSVTYSILANANDHVGKPPRRESNIRCRELSRQIKLPAATDRKAIDLVPPHPSERDWLCSGLRSGFTIWSCRKYFMDRIKDFCARRRLPDREGEVPTGWLAGFDADQPPSRGSTGPITARHLRQMAACFFRFGNMSIRKPCRSTRHPAPLGQIQHEICMADAEPGPTP